MTIANVFRWAARCCPLKSVALACLVAPLIVLPVSAESESAFSLQGFGTLGMARTTTDNVEFVRDLSQPRGISKEWSGLIDSVIGVQGAWRFNRQLEAVVQANSRYRYDKTFTPDIAWAYLKYDPTPNLSLRAGRLGTEFFMMADSRWVGYSFLTVRPPGDYFWYLPFYSISGADAAISIPLGENVLRAKAFYGYSDGKIPLAEEQWDIAGSPMAGAYLEYQVGPWQVRGSYANIRFERDLPLAPVVNPIVVPLRGSGMTATELAFLSTRHTRTHYFSVGAVYDNGPWQAQLMLNHIDQGSRALESSTAAYALIGYRWGAVTPYLGYSWVRSHPRNDSLNFVTSYVMDDSRSTQDTTFAGMRWDVARNIALKAQWDGIRGQASSIFPYRQDRRGNWDGKMDIFSLTMDFVF
ncbi:hypothetical protein [Dechloromonas sp. HYN0024]|uniref:hypothetical protein n=1 Tax=Dechloromonas sp. HYN0024 TaxID=2231055 RepID=UPI000E44FA45|nr:hypothetical protein [Dechloromonas sp. HYN0024]AXS80264.1 hypothetical protein HYN24_09655 [Dechloromonas sp. HYN0024]